MAFLAADLAKAAGWITTYSLYLSVALGGLLAGTWQARLLRPHRQAWWWVPACVLGWSLGGGTAAIPDALFQARQLRGIWGALAYLGLVAVGGAMLGVVTGMALVRIGGDRGVRQGVEPPSTRVSPS